MDIVARATEMVEALTRGIPLFKGWQFTVAMRELKPLPDEEWVSGRIDFDEDIRRAKIWIDVRFPDERETYTLEQVVAHELAHIVCTEACSHERAATRVGEVLRWAAAERANCKCGESA